jgi:GNAT superfamily N-acetyltransferase
MLVTRTSLLTSAS